MSHWTDAGFGTDPEGDAGRRAELEPARLVELPAGGPRGPSVDLVVLDEPAEDEAPYADVPAGYYVREDPDYGEVLVPIEGEVLTSEPDPHAITRTPYPWGVAWRCACGRWEAIATGPSSAGFAERDYGRHRADEEAAARGD